MKLKTIEIKKIMRINTLPDMKPKSIRNNEEVRTFHRSYRSSAAASFE